LCTLWWVGATYLISTSHKIFVKNTFKNLLWTFVWRVHF
jgi:hypothetical protein